jgi:hypothetical protein
VDLEDVFDVAPGGAAGEAGALVASLTSLRLILRLGLSPSRKFISSPGATYSMAERATSLPSRKTWVLPGSIGKGAALLARALR